MMRKRAAILCALLALSVLLASCGNATAQESRVELTKKGEIIEYTVEEFTESNYDADELKTFVDDAVNEYKVSGSGKVKASHVSVEEGTAYLTMSYDATETYTAFNNMACFSGTLLEAQLAGYDLSIELLDATTRQNVSATSLLSDESLQVFIVETETNVQVPGEVRYYYSSYGTAVNLGDDTVQVMVTDELIGTKNIVYVVYSEE